MTSLDASAPPFQIEPLGEHDRMSFSCGDSDDDRALNTYFQNQVTQDIRRRVANCFVVVEAATGQVVGFYTIAAASIALDDLPEQTRKRLPRYPTVPAVRIGRMATAAAFQGRGIGQAMLADASRRAAAADAAVFAVTVDSKNHRATNFYEKFGFIQLPSKPGTLFLPLATVKKADS